MAYSTLKLYKVAFKPEQLACLDSITTYLNTLTPNTITEFQYVKHDLDIQIKVDLYQSYTNNLTYNYISIKNNIDNRTYYYYITNYQWVSQNAVRLFLSMDDLNTFRDLIVFDDNTKIRRIHKDRFTKPTGWTEGGTGDVRRYIDYFPEGLPEMPKYQHFTSKIGNTLQKWYLVYCNAQGKNVADASENDAIHCYLIPENDTTFTFTGEEYTLWDLILRVDDGFIMTGNGSIIVNNTTYTPSTNTRFMFSIVEAVGDKYAVIDEFNVNTGEITRITSFAYDTPVQFTQSAYATRNFKTYNLTDSFKSMDNGERLAVYNAFDKQYNTVTPTGSYTVKGIKNVNRTLSYLVKIIECPYEPLDIEDGIEDHIISLIATTELGASIDNALLLNDINEEFEYTVTNAFDFDVTRIYIDSDDADYNDKIIIRESKLFNSDYWNELIVYDSFVKQIPLELLNLANTSSYLSAKIDYKQSRDISSNLLFKFTFSNGSYMKQGNTDNYLICQRNNEIPLFNSSYLNYLRNGYNFDVKAKRLTYNRNIIGNVLSAVGGAAGIGASAVTGGFTAGAGISLLTSSMKGIASTIISDIQTQNNIDRKIAEARATAIGVEGSEDLNLLNEYLGNKLNYFKYSVTDEMSTHLYELFYKCGYATNEAGIPNITSRKNFNFLECEAEFTTRDNPEWKAYLEDVYEKFRKGVTFFHVYNDFLQQKENWEVWI